MKLYRLTINDLLNYADRNELSYDCEIMIWCDVEEEFRFVDEICHSITDGCIGLK